MRARVRRLLLMRSWGPEYADSNWGLRRVDNFTVCSCPMCGNPRRNRDWASWRTQWAGKTRAEHLADIELAEEIDQLREAA